MEKRNMVSTFVKKTKTNYSSFTTKCPRKYLGIRGEFEKYTTWNFLIYTSYLVQLGQRNVGGYNGLNKEF
jgi:hypothetical protein